VEQVGAVVRALFTVLALASALLLPPGSASAEQSAVWLEITKEPGSEACPDAARVFEAARSLFPDQPLVAAERASSAELRVAMSIAPERGGHLARLVPDGHSNAERRIADPDPACGGLAEALAVALVVWRSSLPNEVVAATSGAVSADESKHAADARATEQPAEPALEPHAPSVKPEPSVPSAAKTAEAEAREPLTVGVEVGALGGVGLFAEPAFGASAGISVWSTFGMGARARLVRAVAAPYEVSPGSVDVSLWAAMLAACYRFEPVSRWSLAPCVELGWGSQHAEARDMRTDNGQADRPWAVVGPSVVVAFLLSEPFALQATGTAFRRVHEQVYTVDAERVATQPLFGAYLGVGLVAEWPFPPGKNRASDRSAPVVALTTEPHAVE
jgi:hypothetical protein